MSQSQNLAIAQSFLEKLGNGDAPEKIAELFSEDLELEIPGDVGALPWIGKQTGRNAVIHFVVNTSQMLDREKFEVQDIIASDMKAIILGDLGTRLKENGNYIESAFAIVLTISNGQIIRFLMLENSFAVSKASRTS